MKLLSLFQKYDNIIFDMDGVITTEQQYWNAAALTVYEFLFSKDYYGDKELSALEMFENTKKIREEVFQNDKTIGCLKNKGVNSNWDLAYVVISLCLIHKTKDFEKIYDIAKNFSDNILDEYEKIALELSYILDVPAGRNQELWQKIMMCFQEWYLGEFFEESYNIKPILSGKKGFILNEEPLIEKDVLIGVLSSLKAENKRLSVATGRPQDELITPIKNFGIYEIFQNDAIITYDYIKNAEEEFKLNLAKPHPYIFIKSMLGKDFPDKRILDNDFDKTKISRTLIVGDAGADLFAAKKMGCDFLAVLTGVSGEKGREYFKENGARYILSSIKDFVM